MAEEQVQPQFIFWVKETGVFRPAALKMPEDYVGCNLERNIELGERDISPDALNLVSSMYLGPINIFQEDLGNTYSRDEFERWKQHNYRIPSQIVTLAEKVGREQRVAYFAVNVVETSKDTTLEFTQRGASYNNLFEFDKLLEEQHHLHKILMGLREPLEFVLHPTVQLYVPRK